MSAPVSLGLSGIGAARVVRRDAPPWRGSPSTRLMILVLVLSIVRLAAGGLIPLTDDEAYYRLWAAHPAMGYYDHPPMIAWWIAGGRRIFGDTPLGVRFLPTVSTAVVTCLIPDIGRQLGFSRTAGERAAVWYNAMLLIALGGEISTPDAPATLFWTATIWAIAKTSRSGLGVWWILAGLSAGLAALSKYSAFFIAPGACLWLLHSPVRRQELRRPWPWIALCLAIVIFLPNLVWNAQHDWLSIRKQFLRVAPVRFTPRHVIDFPATQFVLLNPFIAAFALMGGRLALLQARSTKLLVLSIAPFLVFLMAHSFHAAVQAHWTAPLYPPLALLAADAATQATTASARRAARAAPWVGLGLAAIAMIHIASPQTDWFGRKDAVMTLRGWPSLAVRVEALRRRVHAGWVGTFNYTTVAKLLAEERSAAPVAELNQRARFSFEGPQPPLQGPGLVVELGRRIDDVDIRDCFAWFRRLPDLSRGDAGRRGVAYSVYLVDRPRVSLMNKGCVLERDRRP